jgi:hypothetical protein
VFQLSQRSSAVFQPWVNFDSFYCLAYCTVYPRWLNNYNGCFWWLVFARRAGRQNSFYVLLYTDIGTYCPTNFSQNTLKRNWDSKNCETSKQRWGTTVTLQLVNVCVATNSITDRSYWRGSLQTPIDRVSMTDHQHFDALMDRGVLRCSSEPPRSTSSSGLDQLDPEGKWRTSKLL